MKRNAWNKSDQGHSHGLLLEFRISSDLSNRKGDPDAEDLATASGAPVALRGIHRPEEVPPVDPGEQNTGAARAEANRGDAPSDDPDAATGGPGRLIELAESQMSILVPQILPQFQWVDEGISIALANAPGFADGRLDLSARDPRALALEPAREQEAPDAQPREAGAPADPFAGLTLEEEIARREAWIMANQTYTAGDYSCGCGCCGSFGITSDATAGSDGPVPDDTVSDNSIASNIFIGGLTGTDKWDDGTNPQNISYAYATSNSDYNYALTNAATVFNNINFTGTNSDFVAFAAIPDDFSAPARVDAVQADIETATQLLEGYANLSFVRSTSFQNTAIDFKFLAFDNLVRNNASTPSGLSGLNGRATFPGDDQTAGSETNNESYILYNTNTAAMSTNPELGGSTNRLHVAIHEIQHALGIGHPHDTGNGSGTWTTVNNSDVNDDELDNDRFTVMSAERGDTLNENDQNNTFGYSATPMALDIAALHYLYGSAANHTGNTIYDLTDRQTTALDLFGDDGSVSIGRAFYGIWDTGGIDLIRYIGTNSVVINLNEATLIDNFIAPNISDIIDDLLGSSLYNTIVPSATAGELRQSLTDPDFFAGGFFSRILVGGVPEVGGYSIANSIYATGGQTTVIENARGGNGADILVGNEQANVINGQGGTDLIVASDGADTVYGGSSGDEIYGGDGADDLHGDGGDEEIYGGNGADDMFGGTGDDRMFGGAGVDDFYGGRGTDSMFGGNNDDNFFLDAGDGPFGTMSISGGSGTDQLFLQSVGIFDLTDMNISSTEEIVFGSGDQTLILSNKELDGATELRNAIIDGFLGGSGAEDDIVVNLDFTSDVDLGSWTFQDWDNDWDSITIDGTAAANSIIATLQNDIINPGAGQDRVDAGAGDDTINDTEFAGPGDTDSYNGGAGIDTVINEVDFSGSVLFDLTAGMQSVAGSARDIYVSIENLTVSGDADIIGSSADNTLIASDAGGIGNNSINGENGDDVIRAGDGDDVIYGGRGVDSMYGEGGNDRLGFESGHLTTGNLFDGGTGVDDFTFEAFSSSYDVNLATGVFETTAGASQNTLVSIENVFAGAGDDILTGSNGDNLLYGGIGNDTIRGNRGNDSLFGGSGDDNLGFISGTLTSPNLFDGGTGADLFFFGDFSGNYEVDLTAGTFANTAGGSQSTLVSIEHIEAGSGDDILRGTTGNNTILAGAGSDVIYGNATTNDFDDDWISGGDGNDSIYANGGFADAGTGNDYVRTINTAAETYFGGSGTDTLDTSLYNGSYTVDLDAGNTNFGEVFAQFENYVGGNGNHVLTGTLGDNSLTTGSGSDVIYGNSTTNNFDVDQIYSGAGDDSIYASGGFADAGSGNDYVRTANTAGETYYGGDGTDTLDTSLYNNAYTIDLEAGTTDFGEIFAEFENLILGNGANSVTGTGGTNSIQGGTGTDVIDAGAGADTVNAGAGDDTVQGGAGGDDLDGGTGTNTLSYAASFAGVSVALDGAIVSGGHATGDIIANFQNLVGSDFDDVLFGEASANTISAGAGGDVLSGEGGSDVLYGGAGFDALSGVDGGAGAADTLFGGADLDIAYYFTAESEQLVDFTDHTNLANNSGEHTLDTWDSIEGFYGANAHSNTIIGDGQDNLFLGGIQADALYGGAGSDVLIARDGADLIYGGIGNDFMSGDAGDDTIFGGTGEDVFYVFATSGIDRIGDYSEADDGFLFYQTGATQWSDLTFSQSGNDVHITLGGGSFEVIVEDTALADLDNSAGNFSFL